MDEEVAVSGTSASSVPVTVHGVVVGQLRMSYSLRLSNLTCRCSSVSLSRRRLYCSLYRLRLSSTPSIVFI